MIASAVIVPSPDPEPSRDSSSSPTLKRRQSSLGSPEIETSKRPRLDSQNDAQIQTSNSPPPPRRRPTTTDTDRTRNKRLFGALLGTLSASQSNSTSLKARQGKRDEIEARQREKLRAEREEVERDQREKREEVERVRRREMWKWEEEGMRVRHEGARAQAGFLKTESEPALYWRPWELREHEEEKIRQQREEVEQIIEREVREWEEKERARRAEQSENGPRGKPDERDHETHLSNMSDFGTAPPKGGHEEEGTDFANGPAANPLVDGRDVVPSNTERPKSRDKVDERHHDDHGGEELVEGQEDDVIY